MEPVKTDRHAAAYPVLLGTFQRDLHPVSYPKGPRTQILGF